MKTFRVAVPEVVHRIYIVKARNAAHAKKVVEDDDGDEGLEYTVSEDEVHSEKVQVEEWEEPTLVSEAENFEARR